MRAGHRDSPGAELANVINEAALIAARRGLKAITLAELEEARDKVRWGRERRSLAMSEKEKISTAWHEAGHAIVNVLLEHTHPLHKVTIIPRANFLGATMYLPEGDKYSTQRKEALDLLAVTAAGTRLRRAFHQGHLQWCRRRHQANDPASAQDGLRMGNER